AGGASPPQAPNARTEATTRLRRATWGKEEELAAWSDMATPEVLAGGIRRGANDNYYHSWSQPGGSSHQRLFDGTQRVGETQTIVARPPEGEVVATKEALEAFHTEHHAQVGRF